jgi:hypothetical protein
VAVWQGPGALAHAATVFGAGIYAARNFTLGDFCQHICVRGRWFRPEIPIISSQIAEIFRNCFHRAEGIIESLKCARKGAV